MPEKITRQPSPESYGKEAWLKELNSKETRKLILGYIFNLKMGFSPEDAEDVVQQVMFKAVRAIEADKFRGDSKLTTWLSKITKNQAFTLLRKQKMRSPRTIPLSDVAEIQIPSGEPSSEEKYITAEEAKNLRSHFDKLKPKKREILELLAKGLDNKEIAERLGKNIGTVKSQASKARRFLRESMKNEDQK